MSRKKKKKKTPDIEVIIKILKKLNRELKKERRGLQTQIVKNGKKYNKKKRKQIIKKELENS